MNIKPSVEGEIVVLELTGRFDKFTAPAVAEWLAQTTVATPSQIVVEMSDVPFVDSIALATLVQGLKRSRLNGGELFLCGLQRPVLMIFELTRLDKAFNIFVDREHAIQAFANA